MAENDHMPTSNAIDAETLDELRRLARSRPRSGRGMAAKMAAIRLIDRLQREGSRSAIPPMPSPDWYPPEWPPEFAELYEYDWQRRPELREREWRDWWSRHR
jgi:hypothetical protein